MHLLALSLAALLSAPAPSPATSAMTGVGRTLASAAPGVSGAPDDAAPVFTERERRRILRLSPLPAAPVDETNRVESDPRAAVLGQRLFFDTGLSPGGDVSCATCHQPDRWFTDGRPRGVGLAEVDRNTPTIVDAAHQRWFFWDGRADSLWAQALEPIEDPREMGGDRVGAVRHLLGSDALRREYESIFGAAPVAADPARLPAVARPVPQQPDAAAHRAWLALDQEQRDAVDVVFANLGKALAAYQRRLVSGPSAFDRFVKSLRENQPPPPEMSAAAQRGLHLFIGEGNCRLCHHGPRLSDGEFHSIGLPARDGGPLTDAGRYAGAERAVASPFNAVGPHSDDVDGAKAEQITTVRRSTDTWGQFRTPSLRHVGRTAPYGHDGQLATLEDVVRHYSTLENAVFPGHHRETILQPLDLDDGQVSDLVAFLESLTGTPPPSSLLTSPPPAMDP